MVLMLFLSAVGRSKELGSTTQRVVEWVGECVGVKTT